MLNRQALFTDETVEFKSPYEPKSGDSVTLRFRTLKNDALKVYVIVCGTKRVMKKLNLRHPTFDFYECTFVCPDKKVYYYFSIVDEDDQVYYNRLGAVNNNQAEYNFSFVPGFTVPDWAKGRVFYQIFTDRFFNGDESNDVQNNEYYYTGGHSRKITQWEKVPDTLDVGNFYGGDLQGVRAKLDYLQDLGVEGVYFNPLFISPSNHKYDTQDYDHIDPHLAVIEEDGGRPMEYWEHHNGYAEQYIKRITSETNLRKSNEYFASLVDEMHDRGMKVIIDGVFNHCGSFNKWMDREGIYLNKDGYELGAYQSTKSPYRKFFDFTKNEKGSEYEGWWGVKTLPKLNYEKCPELTEYILSTGAKWVSKPYNVDGWRLDVAADLGHSKKYNHKFWQEFRKSVKGANPEAFIFAEHYGDPSEWFGGDEWDSVMNYDAFMEPVTWFLTGMEKHSEQFDESRLNNGKLFFDLMFNNMARFPRPSLDSAINQLSNHDHSRFLTRTNKKVGTLKKCGGELASVGVDTRVMMLALLIQMTWCGSPTLYYGDEAGQVGWTDPDSRRTYPWGHENRELLNAHKDAIAMRKKAHCIKMGSLKELDSGYGYISYGRFDGEDCVAVIVNNLDKEIALSVSVWEIGLEREDSMQLLFAVNSEHSPKIAQVKYGRMYVKLPARSGCVYHAKIKK